MRLYVGGNMASLSNRWLVAAAITVQLIGLPAAMASGTTVVVGDQPLMNIVVGADGMSAAQRATLIQRNLDNALLDTRNCEPVVKFELVGEAVILTLNGHYIATADETTARALHRSRAQMGARAAPRSR
jgi:hypothetical protein